MARVDPLLPNVGIVARREYLDRVRSRLYRVSTMVLIALAVGVALTPILLRYIEQSRTNTIAVGTAYALGSMPGLYGMISARHDPAKGPHRYIWRHARRPRTAHLANPFDRR